MLVAPKRRSPRQINVALSALWKRIAVLEEREAEMEARIQQLEELLFEKDELEDAE